MPFRYLFVLLGASVLLTSSPSAQAQLFRRDCAAPCVCPPACCPVEAAPAPTPTPPAEPGMTPEATPPAPPPMTLPTTPASSNTASPYEVGDLGGGALSTFDSVVGYIDDAIPSNVVRLRVDAAWDDNRPDRAEFFYSRDIGLKGVSSLNYEEIMAYVEGKLRSDFSVFIEGGTRFVQPVGDVDHNGFTDMTAGFKWAFFMDQNQVATFQTKLYIPTGDPNNWVGTGHASLEPGLLYFNRLFEKLCVESELRLWIPLTGDDFAGPVVRYGVGFSYGERPADRWWFAPVAEFVGWTVLGGKETVLPSEPLVIQEAAGDTIVNVKLGIRVGLGKRFDIYTGYGRPLTGDVWYKDIWRTEFRLAF
jgi:hypothetical protein